jgi:hypothetical protein
MLGLVESFIISALVRWLLKKQLFACLVVGTTVTVAVAVLIAKRTGR